ncbi:MAG: hypothetical protein P8N76_02135 [Pirellulaceae bacterium]|nr:hypothetical protein [Pirellulaceae bacterium]
MFKRNLLILAAITIATVAMSVSTAQAQQRGRGGRGMFGSGPAELLQREDVQAELNLTDSQLEELKEYNEERRNSLRERFAGGNFGNFGRDGEDRQATFARMREELQKVRDSDRDKVLEILNSKQKDRFGELEFQFQLRRGSARDALVAGGVELDDDDREKLEEVRREIEKETNKQIAEIRLGAQRKIMAAVVSENQIERMMGDAFVFEEAERSSRGAFGGNRGGDDRGGERSRRDRGRRRPAAEESDEDDDEDNGGRRRRRR